MRRWRERLAEGQVRSYLVSNYSFEALQSADILAADPIKLGRSHPGVPTADFRANFVLGRLAILDGDIRSAEKYLLASGKTKGERLVNSNGRNMSLAYELLKRGDDQSKQVVLQYFDEVREFWGNPFGLSAMDRWTKQIEASDTPDFQVDYGRTTGLRRCSTNQRLGDVRVHRVLPAGKFLRAVPQLAGIRVSPVRPLWLRGCERLAGFPQRVGERFARQAADDGVDQPA
jgi:hypothetical protein